MTNKTPARNLKITQDQQSFLAQHVKVWKKYTREDLKIKAEAMLTVEQMIIGQAVPRAIRADIEVLITLAFQAGYEQRQREISEVKPIVYEFSIDKEDNQNA